METFIRCEGKITRVEQELGMSYPAVRSRLNDLIRALGYEVGEPEKDGVSEEERRSILKDVADGKMTAEEAVELLRS